MNLEELASRTAEIAKAVGAFLKAEQSQFSQDRVHEKSRNALVSDVDQNAEEQLVAKLGILLPEAGFITEEETTDQDKTAEYTWVIDPLDGTTNFIHGLPIYSVSVALLQHGRPVIGVVYEVGQDECFVAYQGGGAKCNGRPIHTSATSELEQSLLATGFPYYNFEQIDGFQNTLKHFYQCTRGLRRMGSAAVDLAYTACGRFDGYFEHSLSPWDVAAGILLVREAGGVVRNFAGEEEPLPYRSIIATNNSLAPGVFEVVNKNMGNA